MVMHKLKPMTIFTIHGGSQSKKMVLYVTRTVNIMMIETMDNRIAATPAIIEPVRSDWHRQQVFKIGFAILFRLKSIDQVLKLKERFIFKIFYFLQFIDYC